MCLKVECVVDCQLEEQIAELKLEKKANARRGMNRKFDFFLTAIFGHLIRVRKKPMPFL